jgi:hypothetical protein
VWNRERRLARYPSPPIVVEINVMRKALLALLLSVCMPSGATFAQPALRPVVSIETDPDGTANIRVAEQVYSAFTPERTVENLSDDRMNIVSETPILIRNVRGGNSDYGINISNRSPLSIDNYSFVNWVSSGGRDVYGAAIKVRRARSAPIYVQRVFGDGQQAPDPSYRRSNTDFIGVERNAAPVYVRGATGRRFGDAGVDAKSDVYLMNVTIDGAHRGLRAWDHTRITIANSIINVPPGHEQVWLEDATASVRYYNVLWCIGAAAPSPASADCTTQPTAIGADRISAAEARAQLVALRDNPLPATNDFFRTRIDRVVVEYSRDGGRNWRTMAASGGPGRPPLGDMRYPAPFRLAGGA